MACGQLGRGGVPWREQAVPVGYPLLLTRDRPVGVTNMSPPDERIIGTPGLNSH